MTGWRSMTNEELFELSQDCERRIGQLQAQGVQIGGLGEHYIQTLLETMMGETQVAVAKELHFTWLKDRLGDVEVQLAKAKLMQGIPGAGVPQVNGSGHGKR